VEEEQAADAEAGDEQPGVGIPTQNVHIAFEALTETGGSAKVHERGKTGERH